MSAVACSEMKEVARKEALVGLPSDMLLQFLRNTSLPAALIDEKLDPIFFSDQLADLLAAATHSQVPGSFEVSCTPDPHADRHTTTTWKEGSVQMTFVRRDAVGVYYTIEGRLTLLAEQGRTPRYMMIGDTKRRNILERLVGNLSRREHEVLDGLWRGGTSREIAADLSISTRTVEAHRGNIMRKLNARTLPDLFRKILDDG